MQQKPLTIIGLAGLSNAGKSLIRDYMKRKDFLVFSLGDYIRKELDSRNLEHSYENMRRIARKYAPKENNILIDKFINDIRDTKIENKLIILDGIKNISEVEYLEKYYEVVTIAILASRQTRYIRSKMRGRPDDDSYKNFLKRDTEEIHYGSGEAILLSDHFLINEGTIEELKKNFDAIFSKIQKHPPVKMKCLE